jgi:Flp pilus assembly protein TadD
VSDAPYDWYQRGMALLASGDAHAAGVVLERLVEVMPTRSAREALGRSYFDTGRFADARAIFEQIVDEAPDDDYAHYVCGMTAWRAQDFPVAEEHLAMACVMRPSQPAYRTALGQVRATLRARRDAGLPARGPVHDRP